MTKKNSKKNLSLKELLNNLTDEKKCEEVCDNCSREIYSQTSIYTLPKYLIISFGRICEGNYYSNYINYPKLFDIKCEFENNKEFSYILDCVIEHSGGLGGGHYTSLIPIDKNNDNWVRFSDEYCNGTNTGFESRYAIILLYKLI